MAQGQTAGTAAALVWRQHASSHPAGSLELPACCQPASLTAACLPACLPASAHLREALGLPLPGGRQVVPPAVPLNKTGQLQHKGGQPGAVTVSAGWVIVMGKGNGGWLLRHCTVDALRQASGAGAASPSCCG
jgi:hypothetical protein